MPLGTRVGGPQRITLAPSLVRPQMLERATREWAMSPSRPTVRPSIRPLARRIVIRSSSPWVGCSWAPSPALMIEHLTCWASRWGVPGVGWRTTRMSAPIASMFLAVSMNDSPLERLEPLGGEVLGVGREPLGRQAEAGPRAGRVLEEQVEDDPALERGHLLAAARRDLGERLGGVEDRHDLLGATGPPGPSRCLRLQAAAPGPSWGDATRRSRRGPPVGGGGCAPADRGSTAIATTSSTGSTGRSRTRTWSSRSVVDCEAHDVGLDRAARDGPGRPAPPGGRTPAGPGRRWR